MALMHTPERQTGWQAADFKLKGVDGKDYTLADVKGDKGLVVMFICNHCPYVKAIVDRLVVDTKAMQAQGIGVVAIMPNDAQAYPDDSFENMQEFAKKHGFTFPYLMDETQEVAKTYGAVCTPDFFGFDADLGLQYRGRLDEVNPSTPATPDTKHDLLEAMTEVAKTGQAPAEQSPSMGCSIKWRDKAA